MSDERRPQKQHATSPEARARDNRLLSEARQWVRTAVRRFFDEHPDHTFTVAEVLAELDARSDLPPAWLRFLDAIYYQLRYGLVRNACQALANKGLLETGTTVNAKGREGVVCYQRAPDVQWSVEVTGDGANVTAITDAAIRWARSNPRLLRGAKTVNMTRGSRTEHDPDVPPREENLEEPSVRTRRRSKDR